MRITDLLSKESIRLDGVSDLTEFQAQKKKPFVQWQTLWKRAGKYQIRMLM